ncbi:RlpA-like double-psi beta-barrel domain-containing protein [Sporobolomyces salmoneus]|uniref:RlpA-like double-psi beta-barrel domain-containing protein n=1 Tax=Sporobolomyces salmoneus TaxID=183962 RepID=UPI00317B7CF1
MLSSVTLPLAVAAISSISSVAAFNPGHGHSARSLQSHHSFKRFVAPVDKVSRMVKRVKRGSEKTYSTTAIWYAETGWVGSCGESFTDDDLVIALPLELYPKIDEVSYLCGEKVTVTNDATGASITATVADASQRADFTIFTKAGYEALGGDLDQGELSVTYKFLNSSSSVSSALPESFSTSAVAGANEAQSTVKVTSSATAAAVVTSAAKKLAAVQTPVKTTTTFSPSASATASTSSSSSSDDNSAEDDDEDWICEDVAEDSSSSEESSSEPSSSSAAPAQTTTSAAPQQTTTQAPQSSSTTTSAAAASTSKVYDSSSGSTSLLSAAGIKSFLGLNTGAIASWYHANSGQDSTNGNSWCYYPYNDDTPGIAISLKTMLANFGGDAMAARKAYCGLEVIVTNPDSGTELTLYIADAFDDAWVLTPTSIDVMYNSFSKLFGKQTSNKNDVVKGATWKFTGNRNERYAFDSTGN